MPNAGCDAVEVGGVSRYIDGDRDGDDYDVDVKMLAALADGATTRGVLRAVAEHHPGSLNAVRRFAIVTRVRPLASDRVDEVAGRMQEMLEEQEALIAGGFDAAEHPHATQRVRDALEKLASTHMHPLLFGAAEADVAADASLAARLGALQHLGLAELGVAAPFCDAALASGWEPAIECLRSLGSYRSPGDKCALIVNTCRLIEQRLMQISLAYSPRSATSSPARREQAQAAADSVPAPPPLRGGGSSGGSGGSSSGGSPSRRRPRVALSAEEVELARAKSAEIGVRAASVRSSAVGLVERLRNARAAGDAGEAARLEGVLAGLAERLEVLEDERAAWVRILTNEPAKEEEAEAAAAAEVEAAEEAAAVEAAAAPVAASDVVGADELFPVLTYVVLRANPPHLHSELAYITRCRSPEALRGVQGCYFTHVRAAVYFLERLGAGASPSPSSPTSSPASSRPADGAALGGSGRSPARASGVPRSSRPSGPVSSAQALGLYATCADDDAGSGSDHEGGEGGSEGGGLMRGLMGYLQGSSRPSSALGGAEAGAATATAAAHAHAGAPLALAAQLGEQPPSAAGRAAQSPGGGGPSTSGGGAPSPARAAPSPARAAEIGDLLSHLSTIDGIIAETQRRQR